MKGFFEVVQIPIPIYRYRRYFNATFCSVVGFIDPDCDAPNI